MEQEVDLLTRIRVSRRWLFNPRHPGAYTWSAGLSAVAPTPTTSHQSRTQRAEISISKKGGSCPKWGYVFVCIIVNVPEIIRLSSRNTFVSDILYNTFVTIPLYTIPYTGIPGTQARTLV